LDRIQLFYAVAMGAAASFVIPSVADEGTITAKIKEAGTALQTSAIGSKGDFVNVFEENGTVEGSGGPRKRHCIWLESFINHTIVEPHGCPCRFWMCKVYAGRAEETEAHVLEALRLSPRDAVAFGWMNAAGLAKLHLGEWDRLVSAGH
jgi:hypothetical protein